jgi:hypothetical protein
VNPRGSLALLLVAVLLGGCGSSGAAGNGVAAKPAAEILETSRSAAERAATVHVAGSILGAGKPISINMELVADKGGQGRLTQGDLEIELVGLNKAVYASGNAAFYERFVGAGAASTLRGTWLRQASARGPLRSLAPLTDLPQLIEIALVGHGTLSRGATTRIDGRSAIALEDPSAGGTLYVATTGIPYPLAITRRGPDAGKLVFDRWNQPASITPPTRVIDVQELGSAR